MHTIDGPAGDIPSELTTDTERLHRIRADLIRRLEQRRPEDSIDMVDPGREIASLAAALNDVDAVIKREPPEPIMPPVIPTLGIRHALWTAGGDAGLTTEQCDALLAHMPAELAFSLSPQ